MLEVRKLSFDFPEKPLLQKIDFFVPQGSVLHLRGTNGAGKSTLLKLLAGILIPDEGHIFLNGCPINKDIAGYQQNICYVGHKTGINQLLTVKENYHFELQRNKNSLTFDQLKSLCALDDLEDIPCRLLSAGQRRRVGLMRLWLTNATLWLLDEPFAALDKDSIIRLETLIQQHIERGGAVIFTSHQDISLENYKEYYL